MVGPRVQVPQIRVNRNEIIDLNDDTIILFYENLCSTYEHNPEGFDDNYKNNIEYPRMWFIKLMRSLLNRTEQVRGISAKCNIISIMFRLNIQYKVVFDYAPFSGNYKDTIIMKAHEYIDNDDATNELKIVLHEFLNVVN